ncbi:MAG: S8 family serine peptidase [Planctomycetota bacterium]
MILSCRPLSDRLPFALRLSFVLFLATFCLGPVSGQGSVPLGFGQQDLSLTSSQTVVAIKLDDSSRRGELQAILEGEGAREIEYLGRYQLLIARFAAEEDGAGRSRLTSASSSMGTEWPAYHLGSANRVDSLYLATPYILVGFAPEISRTDGLQRLAGLGLGVDREIDYAPGVWRVRAQGGATQSVTTAEILRAGDGVRFAHVDWLRSLRPREVIPNDPLFGNQWHLKNTGQGGGLVGADTRATHAWAYGQGAGMTIAVIDTGVDAAHGDLLQTLNGYDPVTGAAPGGANDAGSHGTRVAGVVAAMGSNSVQLVGVAPQASIMPIRLLTGSGFATPSEEADCFVYAANNGADVITNSWGPDGVPFPLPPIVDISFSYATQQGRGGLGCPIFWAAGNGDENIFGDEYVGSPKTIAVGATTNFDVRASYSDYGDALDLVAPSSGGSRSISTLTIGSGTTLSFAGTSASAPQAAGTAALMLGVMPSLSWSQLRQILLDSAHQIQTNAALYDIDGHSPTYGHGRLDCEAAVLGALNADPAAPQLSVFSYGVGDINIHISGMLPLAEWRLGISTQLYSPVGSGPVIGLGADCLYTLLAPLGTIPFHDFANLNGDFQWGAIVPLAGVTLQMAVISYTPGFDFQISNAVQASF